MWDEYRKTEAAIEFFDEDILKFCIDEKLIHCSWNDVKEQITNKFTKKLQNMNLESIKCNLMKM